MNSEPLTPYRAKVVAAAALTSVWSGSHPVDARRSAEESACGGLALGAALRGTFADGGPALGAALRSVVVGSRRHGRVRLAMRPLGVLVRTALKHAVLHR